MAAYLRDAISREEKCFWSTVTLTRQRTEEDRFSFAFDYEVEAYLNSPEVPGQWRGGGYRGHGPIHHFSYLLSDERAAVMLKLRFG